MIEPLVSVVVITYNSSRYIIEGLESVKEQTYKNLELIISDDGSDDNTVDLCRNWLVNNEKFFLRAHIITTENNTGVAGNLNRGIRAAQGEWIKTLSGDDKFLPHTIEKYIEFVVSNPNCDICFAKLHFVGDNPTETQKIARIYASLFKQIEIQANQYERYLKNHYIPGTGLFFKKSLWQSVGGYDERFPFCEEFPFTLNVLKNGHIIRYIDKELYVYTIRDDSLSNGKKPNRRNFEDQWEFFKKVKFKEQIRNNLFKSAIGDFFYFKRINAKYFSNSKLTKFVYLTLYDKCLRFKRILV